VMWPGTPVPAPDDPDQVNASSRNGNAERLIGSLPCHFRQLT
jgi:hypothetical protein